MICCRPHAMATPSLRFPKRLGRHLLEAPGPQPDSSSIVSNSRINLKLVGSSGGVPPPPPNSNIAQSRNTGLIAGGVSVTALGLLVMVLFTIHVYISRKMAKTKLPSHLILAKASAAGSPVPSEAGAVPVAESFKSLWQDLYSSDVSYGPRRFSYKELSYATNGFSPDRVLGHGGFGHVYKGVVTSSDSSSTRFLAVKRVSRASTQGEREFKAEVLTIGRLRHRNLVQLLGWCHDQGELLLVYEYMLGGSLDKHLYHNGDVVLSWSSRYNILCGVAAALVYLHVEWEQRIVHRDVKASNVMLDSDLNARLGDFGLARLFDHSKNSEATCTGVAGTWGYMAPEYASSGKVTTKSDVYSFGVLALEVVCGRRPHLPVGTGDECLVAWVWTMHETGNLNSVPDERLRDEYEMHQMRCVLVVGLLCTHPDPQLRLPIKQALQILSGDATLPPLPKHRPVAIYVQPEATDAENFIGPHAEAVGQAVDGLQDNGHVLSSLNSLHGYHSVLSLAESFHSPIPRVGR